MIGRNGSQNIETGSSLDQQRNTKDLPKSQKSSMMQNPVTEPTKMSNQRSDQTFSDRVQRINKDNEAETGTGVPNLR